MMFLPINIVDAFADLERMRSVIDDRISARRFAPVIIGNSKSEPRIVNVRGGGTRQAPVLRGMDPATHRAQVRRRARLDAGRLPA